MKDKKNILLPILREIPSLKTYFYPIWYFYQYIRDFKPKSLLQIGNKALEVYLSEHLDLFSSSTKKNHLIILIEFFKFIKENGYTNLQKEFYNFEYKKLSKFIDNEKKVVEAITNGELEKFIDFVRSYSKKRSIKDNNFTLYRNKIAILMLLFGGFRSEELINIKLTDIDLQNDLYKIKILGKGNKERMVYIPTNYIEEELQDYLFERENLNCNSEYLFITQNCNKLHYQGLYKIVKAMFLKSGVSISKFGGHMLRHSYAVLLLRKGFTTNEIKKLLGHNSIVTTQKYLEVSDSDIENKFNNFISKNPNGF